VVPETHTRRRRRRRRRRPVIVVAIVCSRDVMPYSYNRGLRLFTTYDCGVQFLTIYLILLHQRPEICGVDTSVK
jgi:hypothetical protein